STRLYLPIAAIMAEDQSSPSSPVDEPVVNGLEGSYEFIDTRDNPEPVQTNGDGFEAESSSETSEDNQRFPDEEDNFSSGERVSELRAVERQPFTYPTNFRILYVGSLPNEQLKQLLFMKFVGGLSDIFWEEANNDLQSYEIKQERKSILYPVSNIEDPQYYPDSGVAIIEADFTNRPFGDAFDYLLNQYQKKDNNDEDLVDLCVFFIPTDVPQLTREVIPFMKKLQGKVTIFPIIASAKDLNGSGTYFKNECEDKRKSIARCFEENNIDIFIWKDDGLIQERHVVKGEQIPRWVETYNTKKVLAVEEFTEIDSDLLFEDLKLLRERSLEMRKDRQHDEMVKKRVQTFEWFVEILRTFTIVLTILYTLYLVVFGVWSYAEWSVMSSDLRESLQVVSSATFGNNMPNLLSGGNNINYEDTSGRFEVYQLSRSRFVIDTSSRRDNEASFEVTVKHNPQLLRRYESVELRNGKYEFDIDVSGAKGDVIVEVWEKYDKTARIVKWSPDKVTKLVSEAAVPKEDENGIIKGATNYVMLAAHNIKHWTTPSIQKVKSWVAKVQQNIEDNAISFALASQNWVKDIKEKLEEKWVPVWDAFRKWGIYLKEQLGALVAN
ncbi:1394_t:CDS:2, partial [Ambispora leptoticha]